MWYAAAVRRAFVSWALMLGSGCPRAPTPAHDDARARDEARDAPQADAAAEPTRSPVADTCMRAAAAFGIEPGPEALTTYFARRYRGSNGAADLETLADETAAWLDGPGAPHGEGVVAVSLSTDFVRPLPFEASEQAAFLAATSSFAARVPAIADHDVIGFVPHGTGGGRGVALGSLLRLLTTRVAVLAAQDRTDDARAELDALVRLVSRFGRPATFLDPTAQAVATNLVWQAVARAAATGVLDDATRARLLRQAPARMASDALEAACRGDVVLVCALAREHPERFSATNAADFDRRLDACLDRDWSFAAWTDVVERDVGHRLEREALVLAVELAGATRDDARIAAAVAAHPSLTLRADGEHLVIENADVEAYAVKIVLP